MARLLAAPATSRNTPKLEFVETPTTLAVPLIPRLPLVPPGGSVPTVGRTRTFCPVSLQGSPLLLLVTGDTNWVVVTELLATAGPLVTPLMVVAELPLAGHRVTS